MTLRVKFTLYIEELTVTEQTNSLKNQELLKPETLNPEYESLYFPLSCFFFCVCVPAAY